MAALKSGRGMLRKRDRAVSVTSMELFFDLVYVFAVTQLAHLLLENPTVVGAAKTLLLLLAIWWAWVATTWFASEFDPDRRPVRLLLIVLMLLSLIMSGALPEAFEERGLWFAVPYAMILIGLATFGVVAPGGHDRVRRDWQRTLIWWAASGAFWVAGGLAHGPARSALWLLAFVLDFMSGLTTFYVPGLGRSTPADWPINGRHMAQRFQLFILIALGESVLQIGVSFHIFSPGAARQAAVVTTFLASVALWWTYFDRNAEATDVMAHAADPSRLARSAYTYPHLPMVAGIIVTAVGGSLVIEHPTDRPNAATIATVLGGPTLFLAGHTLFRWTIFGQLSASRVAAIAVLIVLAPVGIIVPPVILAMAATLVITAVAVQDTWAQRPAHSARRSG